MYAVFKMDNQQGPTVWHMVLCSMLYGSLYGRGFGGIIDTCICMAESLCCPPETITALLIGYTPIKILKITLQIFLKIGLKGNGANAAICIKKVLSKPARRPLGFLCSHLILENYWAVIPYPDHAGCVSRGQAVNRMLFSETLTNKALCMFLVSSSWRSSNGTFPVCLSCP